VTRTWSRALALSTVLLGLGYVISALLWWVNRLVPGLVGLVIAALGLFLVVAGAGVWRGRSWAKIVATLAGLIGTLLFGAAIATFHTDPEVSDLTNEVGAGTGFGLAVLSVMVLATAVVLAVAETTEARHRPAPGVG